MIKTFAEAETALGEHGLNLNKAGLAKVLVGEQFWLGDHQQIAQRPDVHLLEAVATADTQLKVGDRSVKFSLALGFVALVAFVVEGFLAGADILHEETRASVIRL